MRVRECVSSFTHHFIGKPNIRDLLLPSVPFVFHHLTTHKSKKRENSCLHYRDHWSSFTFLAVNLRYFSSLLITKSNGRDSLTDWVNHERECESMRNRETKRKRKRKLTNAPERENKWLYKQSSNSLKGFPSASFFSDLKVYTLQLSCRKVECIITGHSLHAIGMNGAKGGSI